MKTATKHGAAEKSAAVNGNGRPALILREASLFAVHLREEAGGEGRDEFFVEALDIEDAARRGRQIAIYQSASERGGVFWEVERVQAAGTVRRLFAELKK